MEQMVIALVGAVESPVQGLRIISVPEIRMAQASLRHSVPGPPV